MNTQFWWHMTRAAGIVGWLMLTASVIWGVILSTKAFPEQRRPAWILDLHRWLGGLAVAFTALHLVALVADNYVHFGLLDISVPFVAKWKTGAVALGVFAAWSLLAVEATSLAKRRLSKRVWRMVHLSSYVTFWLTSLHGAFAGSDQGSLLYQVTAAASVLAIAWALMYRITNRRGIGGPPTVGAKAAPSAK